MIGAGFASGQEIVQFFVIYDRNGLYGTVLSGLLFGVMGGILLILCSAKKVNNYQQLLKDVFGRKWGGIVDFCLSIFLFFGICTMFSASGAVFHEHLYLPKSLGILLAYVTVLLLLAGGIRGLVLSYNLLVPVKILLLLSVAGYAAFFAEGIQTELCGAYLSFNRISYWGLAAVLYVAYNFALATVILPEYQVLVGKRDGIIGATAGGLALGVAALLYYLALTNFAPVILQYEVPMLFIAGSIAAPVKLIYIIVLWIGILTTAIADSYGFAQRFSEFTGISYRVSLLLVLTAALPLSFKSFSFLVATVYPLFGVIGLVILAGILIKTATWLAGWPRFRSGLWWARF